jgi:D-lactate dehydrogenase (cytochrome)
MNLHAATRSDAITALGQRFGDALVISAPIRALHANTTTWIAAEPPDAVLFPQSTGEVQEAVRICAAHRFPVIAFGTGTSFEGHVNAPQGGLCLDFARMNQVLAVHERDFDAVVEPGVTRLALNAHLRATGLQFPVDPGADASIGGMASTRASGTTAVRYGTMRENVLSVKAVLASGEVISTGARARKSSAGYDLTRLFVGAEGTLGILTELTLRLHALPEATGVVTCRFPTLAAACDTAILTIEAGLAPSRIELLDAMQIRVVNAATGLGLPEAPMLFVEFGGSPDTVAADFTEFREIAEAGGAEDLRSGLRPEECSRLWKARHDVFWASKSFRPGAEVVVSDVCVPISQLADCIEEARADIERSELIAPIVGHVGDGNFHALLLVRMEDAEEVARAKRFLDRLARLAIEVGGTCTGEHGIGQGKRKFLEAELGSEAVAAMRALKAALDPYNILNPGKIF